MIADSKRLTGELLESRMLFQRAAVLLDDPAVR